MNRILGPVIIELDGDDNGASGRAPWLVPVALGLLCVFTVGVPWAGLQLERPIRPGANQTALGRSATIAIDATAPAAAPEPTGSSRASLPFAPLRAHLPAPPDFAPEIATLIARSPSSSVAGLIEHGELDRVGMRFVYRLPDERVVVLVQMPVAAMAGAPPPSRGSVRVRGQSATVGHREGVSTLDWSEAGIWYQLSGAKVQAAELVRLANLLREPRRAGRPRLR